MNEGPMPTRRMRRQAAATYLGTSVGFLEKAAVRGDGPPFTRLSARLVVYDERDLDAWMDIRRVGSTSGTPGAYTVSAGRAVIPSPSPNATKIAYPPPKSAKRLRRSETVARPHHAAEAVTQ